MKRVNFKKIINKFMEDKKEEVIETPNPCEEGEKVAVENTGEVKEAEEVKEEVK
jgi:hypothetical protein